MFSKTLVLAAGIAVAATGASIAQRTQTDSSTIWQNFLASPDHHPQLPNNSYAGYHRGEKPLPDVPVVANVLSHGAVADGVTDCSEAFRNAIIAAHRAGGGAVAIPAGTYALADPVWLDRSRVVLRGEGQGQTILKFTRNLLTSVGNDNPNGTNIWAWSGGLVWMGPRGDTLRTEETSGVPKWLAAKTEYKQGYNSSANPWEYWRQGAQLTNMTGTHQRGDRTIQVADATGLRAGMFVLMTYDNTTGYPLWRDIGGHPAFDTWELYGDWFQTDRYPRWQWTVEIESVNGNEVTLRQPLRVATQPVYNVRLWRHGPYIEESGVENLSIELNGGPTSEDIGWNGFYMQRSYNCWVRNVEVVNGNNGFHVAASKNCTLLNTTVRGDRWVHHPYNTRCMTHDVLFDGITINVSEDSKGGTHGLNCEFLSAGNVWTRGVINRGTFDTHRGMPFDMLRTEITLRNEANSNPGGDPKAGAYAGRGTVHWNITVQNCNRVPAASGSFAGWSNTGLYVYQPDIVSRGALVGIKGTPICEIPTWSNPTAGVMPAGNKDVLIADEGITPAIPNLYDAMLAERAARMRWIHFTAPTKDVLAPNVAHTVAVHVNPSAAKAVTVVRFYANSQLIGTDTEAPYGIQWTPASRNAYNLRAEFEDNTGVVTSTVGDKWVTVGSRITLEENHPSLTYGGGSWSDRARPSYFGGGARHGVLGRSVQLSFTGSRIRFYSTGDNGSEVQFNVFLNDLTTPLLFKNIRNLAGYRELAWDSGVLPNQQHTVRIVSTGQLTVDAIEIDSTTNDPSLSPPTSLFNFSPSGGDSPLLVQFNGGASYDTDGNIVQYRWDFGDGSPLAVSELPTLQHTYTADGTYQVSLTVVDNDNLDHQRFQTLIVGNHPPVALVASDVTSGDAPLAVNFTGSSSSDSDGTIASYEWDFDGDGSYDASGATAQHVYQTGGTYAARLRVTDDDGATATASVQIQVLTPTAPGITVQPQPVSAYAGADAVFSVQGSGYPAPTVQWFVGNDVIPGAISNTLTVPNLTLADSGKLYRAVLTNSQGTVSSNQALLTVTEPPGGTSVRVVDWGGDYVGANRDFGRAWPASTATQTLDYGDDGVADDRYNGLPFSEDIPWNPVIGTNYNGTSARFYGGSIRWRLNTTLSNLMRNHYVQQRDGGDALYTSLDNGPDTHDFRVLVWKKEDFLALTGVPITFNQTSALRLVVTTASVNFPQARFVVKSGGQYYLSQARFVMAAGQVLPITLELSGQALINAKWAAYSPQVDLRPLGGSTTQTQSPQLGYVVPTSDLTNIEAVGVFSEREIFSSGGNTTFAFSDFEVDAVPYVVEPGGYSAWSASYFAGENASQGAGGLDPDGDGLANLVEYLMGLNPTAGDAGEALLTAVEDGLFKLRFRVAKAAVGLDYEVQSSSSLGSWTEDPSVTVEVVADEGDHFLMEASAPLEGRKFLRLEVQDVSNE